MGGNANRSRCACSVQKASGTRTIKAGGVTSKWSPGFRPGGTASTERQSVDKCCFAHPRRHRGACVRRAADCGGTWTSRGRGPGAARSYSCASLRRAMPSGRDRGAKRAPCAATCDAKLYRPQGPPARRAKPREISGTRRRGRGGPAAHDTGPVPANSAQGTAQCCPRVHDASQCGCGAIPVGLPDLCKRGMLPPDWYEGGYMVRQSLYGANHTLPQRWVRRASARAMWVADGPHSWQGLP